MIMQPSSLSYRGASLAVALAGVLACSPSANASVIVSFDADSMATAPDPMSAAGGSWVARRAFPSAGNPAGSGTATPPANRVSGSETIGGTSRNYVTFSDTSTTAIGALAYDLAGTPAVAAGNATGWTATATVRTLEATVAGGRAGHYFRVFANGREHYIAIFNDPAAGKQGVVFWDSSYSTSNPDSYMDSLIAYDVASDYVTYQLYYDPETLSTTLYINGEEMATKAIANMAGASSNIYSSGVNRAMEWGRATTNGSTDAHWNEVRFETGYAVIPEPSTFALAGAGLLGITALRRRARKA